jgi:hypothetical protein
MSKEAMKLALEALETYHGYMEPLTTVFGGPRVPAEQSTTGKVETAITSLRQALEEALAKQEPDYKALWQQMCERCDELDAKLAKQEQGEPVAVITPMSKYADASNCLDVSLPVGTKLYTTPQPKQEQGEPVAWMDKNKFEHLKKNNAVLTTVTSWGAFDDDIPLYTTPQSKQEQKEDFFKQIGNQSMMQLWQNYCDVKVERDELQEKLAKQEQGEPVAYMRMPKVGDRVVCIEDEDLGTVQSLTAGGSPDIKFDDGSHGTYLLREFAELFRYVDTTPQQPVIDKSAAIRIATALGWTPPKQEQGEPVAWKSVSDFEIYEMYNEPRSDAEMLLFARELEAELKRRNKCAAMKP